METTVANELDLHATTYDEDQRFYAENMLTEGTYCRRVLEAMQARNGIRLLSLGLGHGVTARKLNAGLTGRLKSHVVLEGSREMIERFTKQQAPSADLSIVECFFENFESDEKFDAIEMGFVLEHVEDPDRLLSRYRELLAAEGSLFIGVPNALSLHRRLGHLAGKLADPYQLSDMDLKYGHRRYFDLDSLQACVIGAGLRIHSAQGLFMKPFTEMQMQSLKLAPAVWDALAEVSRDYPGIANSIFLEARF
jgi:SAM-dependent methyltransferase